MQFDPQKPNNPRSRESLNMHALKPKNSSCHCSSPSRSLSRRRQRTFLSAHGRAPRTSPSFSPRARLGNRLERLTLPLSFTTENSSCCTRARRLGHLAPGYAESADGIHFRRDARPVLSPEIEYEKDAALKTRASRNSATPGTSLTRATTRRTRSSASPLPSISFIGSARA